ncbi:hypothetical protein GCM10027345_04800 [Hymenobacter daeguensis]
MVSGSAKGVLIGANIVQMDENGLLGDGSSLLSGGNGLLSALAGVQMLVNVGLRCLAVVLVGHAVVLGQMGRGRAGGPGEREDAGPANLPGPPAVYLRIRLL